MSLRRRARVLGVQRSPVLAPLLAGARPFVCEAHGEQLHAEWAHAHAEADRCGAEVYADAEQLCCMAGCVLTTAGVFGASAAIADADGALWVPRLRAEPGPEPDVAETTSPVDAPVYSWGDLPAVSAAGFAHP